MKAQLKNVMPNPFRDMDKYPIHPQKVEALKKSIEDTDFWDNIVARKSPTHKGKIEIAYGHHRLVTLKELYAGTEEFNFIVRDLDDEEMLKIMAHENLDEWGHVSDIERETVRAVVYAFAADKIALAKPQGKTPESALRYAPSFCFGCSDGSAQHPYTADTIRDFLAGTMSSKTVQKTFLRASASSSQVGANGS
jgi:ParB-like chromosome segregation protein Spo0J